MDTTTHYAKSCSALFCPGPIIHKSLSVWKWSDRISRHKRDILELMEEVCCSCNFCLAWGKFCCICMLEFRQTSNFTKVHAWRITRQVLSRMVLKHHVTFSGRVLGFHWRRSVAFRALLVPAALLPTPGVPPRTKRRRTASGAARQNARLRSGTGCSRWGGAPSENEDISYLSVVRMKGYHEYRREVWVYSSHYSDKWDRSEKLRNPLCFFSFQERELMFRELTKLSV